MRSNCTLGVIKTSHKENEKRVPIYPAHLSWIAAPIRERLVLESGYGAAFGFSDNQLAQMVGGIADRSEVLRNSDLVLLPKPVIADIKALREHQTICGWMHCVQQEEIVQAAIDRKVTLIAWEAMHHWDTNGHRVLHVFYKNNELAGYAAVLHALQLVGIDGHYGPRRTVAVIGYGAVSRGAIYALQGRGFNNIHVFTRRPVHLVADQNPDVYYRQLAIEGDEMVVRSLSGESRPLIDELSEADILCNGILQDTDRPMMFVRGSDVDRLKSRSLIVDVSCDRGMGFAFARPTTFDCPAFSVGDNVTYYSVDHTPSYLYDAASREISRALLPYLPAIVGGPDGWKECETIRRAIEIADGRIQNPKILSFQKRSPEYPHSHRADDRSA